MTTPAVAVFGSSQTLPGTPEWDSAAKVGEMFARSGFAVITGGYGGTMEAASAGAHGAGGHVVGVTVSALFPNRVGANRFVTEVIDTATLTDRIGVMLDRASGVIALPGSIGTAAELLVAWNGNHIGRRNGGGRLPAVAVGEEWARLAGVLLENSEARTSDIHLEHDAVAGAAWLVRNMAVL